MNRSKSAAVLLLLGAFAVGGASGYVVKAGMDQSARTARQKSDRELRRPAYKDLGLSELQSARLDSIIDKRNKDIRELYAPLQPKADSIRTAARQQQFAVLTPDQRTKLEQLWREFEENRTKSQPMGGGQGRRGPQMDKNRKDSTPRQDP